MDFPWLIAIFILQLLVDSILAPNTWDCNIVLTGKQLVVVVNNYALSAGTAVTVIPSTSKCKQKLHTST